MNWYNQQKVAINWPAFIGGKPKPKPVQQQARPQSRTKQVIEKDKNSVMTQMNYLRNVGRETPEAKQKMESLHQRYQELLTESSNMHDSNYDAMMSVAPKRR